MPVSGYSIPERGDNIVEWTLCAEAMTLGVNFEALVEEELCLCSTIWHIDASDWNL